MIGVVGAMNGRFHNDELSMLLKSQLVFGQVNDNLVSVVTRWLISTPSAMVVQSQSLNTQCLTPGQESKPCRVR
jgi:hypothetical protein